jgi:transcription elongation factor SPT4
MKGDADRVMDCTSNEFNGMLALTKPKDSWMARWQRIDRFQGGIYAVVVKGQLPDHIIHILDKEGISYRPREEPFRP